MDRSIERFSEALSFTVPFRGGVVENGESDGHRTVWEPEFTAYEGDPGSFRYLRLASTFGAACATVRLLSVRYQNLWHGCIVTLHDHKGTLEVTWRDRISRVLFEGAVLGAWEAHAEHCHQHHLAE